MTKRTNSVRINLLILLLFGLAAIYGCSQGNDLDRTLAKQLLTERGAYPAEVVGEFNVSISGGGAYPGHREQLQRQVEMLNESGLVAISSTVFRGHDQIEASFTESGLPYSSGEIQVTGMGKSAYIPVVLSIAEFGEVTGVSYIDESKSTALVEYTELHSSTPFGDIHAKPEFFFSGRKEQEAVAAKQATFQLFDDGWRVRE